MKIDRLFLVIAAIYILIGMGLGSYMGMNQDFTHRTAHTHINLPGFVSMTLFALIYRSWPAHCARPAIDRKIPTGMVQNRTSLVTSAR